MSFVHTNYHLSDTIAAIATPIGEGGVAIIRLSGKEAIEIAAKVFSGDVNSYVSHTAHFGTVIDNQEIIDEALLLVMKAPRSYTGENVVEIQCHGGILVARRVLECVIKRGARLAFPGEFTFRSFINGKMDLAQAESVQTLIHAKGEKSMKAALLQMQGRLSEKVLGWKKQLTYVAAILEAWVDFPEEGLEFASIEEIKEMIKKEQSQMRAFLSTFHDGRLIHEGVKLCLFGAPNVGKSSLMNTLLEHDRVIVSHEAGTTRDVVEEILRFKGLSLKLIDTAGIRDNAGHIEREGIKRSKEKMQEADLILCLLDANQGIQEEDEKVLSIVPPHKTIVVWNKIDLNQKSLPSLPFSHVAYISAKTGCGIDELKTMIEKVIWEKGPPGDEEPLLTNARHKEAIEEAVKSLDALVKGLDENISPEFVADDMRICLKQLGRIIGSDVGEDILSSIFSHFCVGK